MTKEAKKVLKQRLKDLLKEHTQTVDEWFKIRVKLHKLNEKIDKLKEDLSND